MTTLFVNLTKLKFQSCFQLLLLPWKREKSVIFPASLETPSSLSFATKFGVIGYNHSKATSKEERDAKKLAKLCPATLKFMKNKKHRQKF